MSSRIYYLSYVSDNAQGNGWWLDATSGFRTGAGLTSTIFGGAAEQTILETKSMFSLRNVHNATAEIRMTRALGATRTITKYLGRTLGFVSAYEHFNAAIDSYNSHQFGGALVRLFKSNNYTQQTLNMKRFIEYSCYFLLDIC